MNYIIDLYFDGAKRQEFSNEDLIAIDPANIKDNDLSEAIGYAPRMKLNLRSKPSFPKYFYDFNCFQHPLSRYFYNQLQLPNYDHIRLKDELLDFKCSSNEALNTIFNTDLQFREYLPLVCEKNTSLIEFCERILDTLHDIARVD